MIETDVVRALAAIVSLLGLGFVMGFSPTLYGITLHLLTSSAQAARSIRPMAAGLAVGATVLVVVFHAVDPETLTAALRGRVDELLVRRGVDLSAGALFVVGGIVVGVRARRPRPAPRPARPGDPHPRRMFAVGLANAVIGFSGIATMYVTGRIIAGISDDLVWKVGAYGAFLITLVGPYLAVARVWRTFPAVAGRITRGYDWVVRRDFRPVLAIVLSVVGLAFIAVGIWGHDGLG